MNDKTNVNLKMHMFQKRISNGELAKRVGLTPTAISQIINGHREPKLTTALKIADVLETTVEHLWGHLKEGKSHE